MIVKFYAGLRRTVGSKIVEVNLTPGDTVRSVLTRLTGQFPALKSDMWNEAGELTDFIHVFVNSREVKYLADRLDTHLQEKDVLDIFPPVAGGISDAQPQE
jgi:MoaD family protein